MRKQNPSNSRETPRLSDEEMSRIRARGLIKEKQLVEEGKAAWDELEAQLYSAVKRQCSEDEWADIAGDEPIPLENLTVREKDKREARVYATELWKQDPTTTIKDMAVNLKKKFESYQESTYRTWIKDLAHNRNPGRRPKKNR